MTLIFSKCDSFVSPSRIPRESLLRRLGSFLPGIAEGDSSQRHHGIDRLPADVELSAIFIAAHPWIILDARKPHVTLAAAHPSQPPNLLPC